jgi:hypothetical protein
MPDIPFFDANIFFGLGSNCTQNILYPWITRIKMAMVWWTNSTRRSWRGNASDKSSSLWARLCVTILGCSEASATQRAGRVLHFLLVNEACSSILFGWDNSVFCVCVCDTQMRY